MKLFKIMFLMACIIAPIFFISLIKAHKIYEILREAYRS